MGGNGRTVWDFENIAAPLFDGLPVYDELVAKVEAFAGRLAGLAESLDMDGYYLGPVLFEDYAVSHLFLSNLAAEGGLFAHRRPVAVSSTVYPPEDVSGLSSLRTLEGRLGERVLDASLNVYNYSDYKAVDASVYKRIIGMDKSAAGVGVGAAAGADVGGTIGAALLGSYTIDVQGVRPPRELVLVRGGVVKGVMSHRVPTLGSPLSSGSMRGGIREGGMSVSLAPGILLVDGSSGSAAVSRAALKKELLKRAKVLGLEYAYIVRKFMGGSNQVVYKVSVKSGKEAPVLGASVTPIPLNRLMNLGPKSFSRELSYENTMYRNTIPMSIIHPASLLLNNVEILE